jgi:hypothetical protein
LSLYLSTLLTSKPPSNEYDFSDIQLDPDTLKK